MHSSLIFLTLCSVALVALMITCFICFMRSRREEDEELVEQVQYNSQRQQQPQQLLGDPAKYPQQQIQQQTPNRQKSPHSPSNNMMINDVRQQQQQQAYDQQGQVMADFQQAARNSYALAASPYHAARNETRNDITQQINSAIIGSSEAEFQNDFIQVFPMYQIAPQPEKNTTPYLT